MRSPSKACVSCAIHVLKLSGCRRRANAHVRPDLFSILGVSAGCCNFANMVSHEALEGLEATVAQQPGYCRDELGSCEGLLQENAARDALRIPLISGRARDVDHWKARFDFPNLLASSQPPSSPSILMSVTSPRNLTTPLARTTSASSALDETVRSTPALPSTPRTKSCIGSSSSTRSMTGISSKVRITDATK